MAPKRPAKSRKNAQRQPSRGNAKRCPTPTEEYHQKTSKSQPGQGSDCLRRGRSMSVSDQGRGFVLHVEEYRRPWPDRPAAWVLLAAPLRSSSGRSSAKNDRARPILSAFLMPCLVLGAPPAIVRQEIDRTNLSGWRALTKHAWAHRSSLRALRVQMGDPTLSRRARPQSPSANVRA